MEASERLMWIESTLFIFIYLPLINNNLASGVSTKENIACYGNYHNFVELECEDPQLIINVTRVLLGAKPAVKNCPMTTNTDNYKEECCRQESGDCMIATSSQVASRCIGLNSCKIQTIWTLLNDVCQPNTYPRFTNFMSVRYLCGNRKDKPSTTTTTTRTYPTSSTIKRSSYSETPSKYVVKTESTTLRLTTLSDRNSSPETSPSSAFLVHNKKSSMTGIIIGISCGFLGMLLSALGLWIYCSRKNQTASKPTSQALPPPSHFLGNILSYSKTRKSFCKGYNNFSNLMPSTNQVLTRRDGQHVQILRSPSDASDHSNQSPRSNPASTSATVSTTVSSLPPHVPTSSSSDRSRPQGITILNNFSCL